MYDKWNQNAIAQQPQSKKDSESADEPALHAPKKKTDNRLKSDIDIIEQYFKEIRLTPLLSREEEIYYAKKAQNGDEKARHRMIESNLRLVVKIAKRYQRS